MNRRDFLKKCGLAALAAPAVAVAGKIGAGSGDMGIDEFAECLEPARKAYQDACDWERPITSKGDKIKIRVPVEYREKPLTHEEITREALRVLHSKASGLP